MQVAGVQVLEPSLDASQGVIYQEAKQNLDSGAVM